MPLITTWQSGGETYSVATYKNLGESTADWIARHFARVASKMDQYPPE